VVEHRVDRSSSSGDSIDNARQTKQRLQRIRHGVERIRNPAG
jgi:hypothetical protein